MWPRGIKTYKLCRFIFKNKYLHLYELRSTFHLILKDFLESEGIVVNAPDQIPEDPYLATRTKAAEIKKYNTPSSFDKLKQFLELDRKVLRFFCVWDDRDAMFGEMRPFILHVSI